MLLDFDVTVVGIASQPFWLSWTAADGRSRSHVPDYFARRTDGSAVVIDCRPVGRRDGPRDVAAFGATRRACAEAVGDPAAVLPVVFHLLWRHELVVDLSVPLHPATVVSSTAA